jgi:hypothetical protein
MLISVRKKLLKLYVDQACSADSEVCEMTIEITSLSRELLYIIADVQAMDTCLMVLPPGFFADFL